MSTDQTPRSFAGPSGPPSADLDLDSIWDAVADTSAPSGVSPTPPPSAVTASSGRSLAQRHALLTTDTLSAQPTSGDLQRSSSAPEGTAVSVQMDALTHAARMHGVLVRGSTFGVYTVGHCIGEGGMARVYQAEHEGLRRQVALKVLINGFAKDADGRERFVREARIAAAIKHPNVVNIFDVGVHEDIPYLVMELLEGTDLESLLQSNNGPLNEDLILDIMVPVVAGLIAVHDAGIVHRDLKPGNIFLARGRYEDLEPKLLDFGVSKLTGPDQLKLTTRGLLGTPFYMSPEGLRGEDTTPLSDQYSLGVLMYECGTARAPFNASTLPDLVRIISEGSYDPPQTHNPNLSKRLVRIITRAMSLDPNHRFKDMREFGRELLQLAGQRTRITWGLSFGDASTLARSNSMPPVGGTVPPPTTSAGSRWRKTALWALLPAAAILLFLFRGVGSREPGRPAPHETAAAATPGTPTVVPAAGSVAKVSPGDPVAEESPSLVGQASPSAQERSLVHPRRHRAPFGGRTRAAGEQDETPDWAQPSSNSTVQIKSSPASQPASGIASGTNGAPIFD